MVIFLVVMQQGLLQWVNNGESWDDMVNYPLVICYIVIEHGPVEIVSFPMNSMGIFHSYVQLAEGRFPLVG